MEKSWALYNDAATLCQELSYHQRQLVGVSWGARQGGQAGAHLVVAVTSPDWHDCDVPQSVGLTDPPLSHRRIEIYSGRRGESDRRANIDVFLQIELWTSLYEPKQVLLPTLNIDGAKPNTVHEKKSNTHTFSHGLVIDLKRKEKEK